MVAQFDQEHASSDGGAILLQACDRRLGLTEALIEAIDDRRQSGKIRHAIGDPVCQRLYAIGCGYPDANDASRLGSDPIQKLLCDRDPVQGEELASQPTLSRFENSVDRADLYRMGIALAETVIERHRRRLKRKAKRITIEPNQLLTWDISYLSTAVHGLYLHFYIFLDVFSRKIVAWQIHAEENSANASEVMRDLCRREQIAPGQHGG